MSWRAAARADPRSLKKPDGLSREDGWDNFARAIRARRGRAGECEPADGRGGGSVPLSIMQYSNVCKAGKAGGVRGRRRCLCMCVCALSCVCVRRGGRGCVCRAGGALMVCMCLLGR